MSSQFRAALDSGRIILFDGAMGTMLAGKSWTAGAVHRAYRAAGAEVLITNTFDLNRRMREADPGSRTALETECRAACADARAAAGEEGFVAGDMGPTGALLEPYGTMRPLDMRKVFLDTARILAGCGMDLFVVETMSDAREMTLALQACREANRDIPVAASMAFDPSRQGGFRTNMGVSPTDAAKAMVAAGADIVGANCGSVTPEQTAVIVREFRGVTTLPILAQPNAGVPELRGGQTVFRLAPEEWAAGMLKVEAAGARLLGGCCGTTPEHIRCLRQALDRRRQAHR